MGVANNGISPAEASFQASVGRLGPALLGVLVALEDVQRQLHPTRLASLRDALRPLRAARAVQAHDGGNEQLTLEPGDLDLLDPVRDRARLYRETD